MSNNGSTNSKARASTSTAARPALHLPNVPRPIPYWARLIPPGELPRRAVLVRLVLALVLTVALWVRISADQDPVLAVTYPSISVQIAPPPGYYPVQSPPSVTIRVEGLTSALHDAPAPTAYVDLRSIAPSSNGPFQVHVSGLPDGVEVHGIEPATVRLSFDRQASKMVPVQVQPFGTPPGYIASAPSFTPTSVQVTGPSRTVKTIVAARVVLDESHFHSDQLNVVEPLTLYDGAGRAVSRRIVHVVPDSVMVTVQVKLQPYKQLVPVLPDFSDLNSVVAPGYRISNITTLPQLVTVLSDTQVPPSTVLHTTPITVTGLTARAQIAAPLVVPPNLTLQTQTQAQVSIEVVPIPGSAATVAQLLAINKRGGTTIDLNPQTITVTYQGPIALLGSADAPRAVLDLGQRQPGSYNLIPTITLDRRLTLISFSPERVRVLITAPPRPHVIVQAQNTPTSTPTPPPTSTPTPLPTATATPRPTATPHRRSAHIAPHIAILRYG